MVVHSSGFLVLVQEHPVLLTEAPLNPKATWLRVGLAYLECRGT